MKCCLQLTAVLTAAVIEKKNPLPALYVKIA